MNIKRAIRIALLVYIASFVLSIVYALIAGVDMTSTTDVPMNLYIAGAVISLALSIGATWWYFKPKTEKPSVKIGLYFGLIVIAVGFILDSALIIPYYFSNPSPESNPFVYYADPWFWLTVALVIAGCAATGHILENKK